MTKYTITLILALWFQAVVAAGGSFSGWYETTTHLNVRASDNARARKMTTLPPNTHRKWQQNE